jgi:PST family polysaccharide transporter
MARLLTPDAFGVFAMVVPLGVVANQLGGQCFQTTLLQRPTLSPDETSALFWFAARMNFTIALLMVGGSLVLAWFFDEPRVPGVAAVWALATWLLTLTTFQEARLKRALRFPAVLSAQLAGMIAGIIGGIVAALLGAGYWALMVQLVVWEATRASGVAWISRWLPSKRRDIQSVPVGELRQAWWSLVGFRLANWLNDQPEILAVGRIGGAFTLGLYDTARRWAWLPFEEPYVILTDVAVAGARGSSPESFRPLLLRAVTATLGVSLPVIGFVGASAEWVVAVILGDQWLGAALYLRVLCIVAAVGALARVSFWIPLAQGSTKRLIRWSLFIQAPVTILAVLIGAQWGPFGVALAMAIAWGLMLLPCLIVVLRGSSITPRHVLTAAWRPVVATGTGVAAVIFLEQVLPIASEMGKLAVAWCVFAGSFAVAWLLPPGGLSLVNEVVRTLRAPVAAASGDERLPVSSLT